MLRRVQNAYIRRKSRNVAKSWREKRGVGGGGVYSSYFPTLTNIKQTIGATACASALLINIREWLLKFFLRSNTNNKDLLHRIRIFTDTVKSSSLGKSQFQNIYNYSYRLQFKKATEPM